MTGPNSSTAHLPPHPYADHKSEVLARLEEQGYAITYLILAWDELNARQLDPGVAYIALDSCVHHGAGRVSFWLRNAPVFPLDAIAYITNLRRRALKTRIEWPEKRHEWTNQINRARHYAEKFAAAAAVRAGGNLPE